MTAVIIALTIIVLIVLLLLLPMKIELGGAVYNRINAILRVKFLFGLIALKFDIFPQKAGNAPPDKEVTFYSQAKLLYNILNVNGLGSNLVELIGRIRHRVKIDNIDINLKFSSGDDYYTGLICGLLLPFALIVSELPTINMRLQPNFVDEISIKGYFHINGWVQPVQTLLPTLKFLCSAPFQNARSLILKYNAG